MLAREASIRAEETSNLEPSAIDELDTRRLRQKKLLKGKQTKPRKPPPVARSSSTSSDESGSQENIKFTSGPAQPSSTKLSLQLVTINANGT